MRFLFVIFIAVIIFFPIRAIAGNTTVTRTFVPPNPSSNDTIQLRLDIQGCYSSSISVNNIDVLTNQVTIQFDYEDICDPNVPENFVTPRFVTIGQLPAGIYQVNYVGCTLTPPGIPPCSQFDQATLVVFSVNNQPLIVPSNTMASLGLLIIGFIFFAWHAMRVSR